MLLVAVERRDGEAQAVDDVLNTDCESDWTCESHQKKSMETDWRMLLMNWAN